MAYFMGYPAPGRSVAEIATAHLHDIDFMFLIITLSRYSCLDAKAVGLT
jgi:hypothetical protein